MEILTLHQPKTDEQIKLYERDEYQPRNCDMVSYSRHYTSPNNRDFYREYSTHERTDYMLKFPDFEKILYRVMVHICNEILKGEELQTMFGNFRIWRAKNKKIGAIDYVATSLQSRAAGHKVVVKRTNENYFRIDWMRSLAMENLKRFEFKVNKQIAHMIPKYQHLYTDVPHKV